MDSKSLPNICRACLAEVGEFKSLFVPAEDTGTNIHLAEMISACSSVQITFGDGLPEVICQVCAIETVNMYMFKLKCEESDLVLKQRLQAEKSPLREIYENQEIEERINQSSKDDMIVIKPEILEDTPNDVDDSYDYFDNSKCDSEPESTTETNAVDNHVTAKVEKVKEFECETCFRRFSRSDLLIRHKIAHAIKMDKKNSNESFEETVPMPNTLIIKTEDGLYPCDECEVIFLSKEDMAKHMKKHEKTKHQCDFCLKYFSNSSHLNRHLRIHTNGAARAFMCSTCNKSFPRQEKLTHHMKQVHSGVKPHVCDICYKGFNQISNLKDHMRTHNGEKPFLCSTCGKGFNQLGNLRQHTIRHSGIKAHLCSTCGNGFASKGELSAHLRKHTGARPFVCSICNHGFTTSSSLTKHKRIHSGEKPYQCDVCKMKFSRSGILARHKRTHTGEKPYVCKYCGKAFTQSNDLTSHLRIHTGEKPYICDICGQAFRQSSALKTHKRTHIDKPDLADIKPLSLVNPFLANF